MKTFKCPDCGASITDDSKFCKYCGAKIDDGVQRSEVNVNIHQRIENAAEMKRAETEAKAQAHKQAKEERERKAGKVRIIVNLVLIVLCLAVALIVPDTGIKAIAVLLLIGLIIYIIVSWFNRVTS